MLMDLGIGNLVICDQKGILDLDREEMADHKKMLAKATNKENKKGMLADALEGADIFIGVSVANCVTGDMVEKMNKDAIVFAMANPVPEIMPEIAKEAPLRVLSLLGN